MLHLGWGVHTSKPCLNPVPYCGAGLQNNQLNGSLPSSMTFNQSFGVNALSVDGNNFSGRLPSWPDQPTSLLSIHPGNEGLCGAVRASAALHCWLACRVRVGRSQPACRAQPCVVSPHVAHCVPAQLA